MRSSLGFSDRDGAERNPEHLPGQRPFRRCAGGDPLRITVEVAASRTASDPPAPRGGLGRPTPATTVTLRREPAARPRRRLTAVGALELSEVHEGPAPIRLSGEARRAVAGSRRHTATLVTICLRELPSWFPASTGPPGPTPGPLNRRLDQTPRHSEPSVEGVLRPTPDWHRHDGSRSVDSAGAHGQASPEALSERTKKVH